MTRYTVMLVACLVVAGCGDGTTTPTEMPTTTTTSAPTGPNQASITTNITNPVVFTEMGVQVFTFDMEINESAGLGANINFARLELFRATGEFLERKEIGAGAIAAGVGDNRIEGGTTEAVSVLFTFTSAIKTGRSVVLTVNFTDDRGIGLETVTRFVFS